MAFKWRALRISDLADSTSIGKFWDRVDVETGPTLSAELGRCWLWTGAKHGEYGSIRLGSSYSRPVNASRVSYVLHRGPLSELELVRHKCDNPPCVNPYHLDKGTHQDNSDDMVKRGRSIAGRSWRPISRKFE